MRRLLLLVLAAGLVFGASTVFGQEAGGEHQSGHTAEAPAGHGEGGESAEGGHAGLGGWKWANFLLLAAALGYVIAKNGGSFFSARSSVIRKDMVEAGELRKQAEARMAEVERRLANLESDIAALRDESGKEALAERQRMAQQTAAEMAKIQEQSEQEIVSAGKAARMELKRYAARLSVSLAEQQIRESMTASAQEALVDEFVRELKPPSSQLQAN